MTPVVYLRAEHVEKHYGKTAALQDASLELRQGEILALLGPNGAGKTTLIKILATVLVKDAGRVEILGHDLDRHVQEIRHLFGYVGQDTERSAYARLTVAENLHFFGALRGMPKRQIDQQIEKLATYFDFHENLAKLFIHISGGQKQTVVIMRGLLHETVLPDGEVFAIDLSVGIALCPDPQSPHAEDVMRLADTALHKAKAEGGARTTFFEAAMGEAVEQRFRVERELRQAIAQGDLRCHLQSQVRADGQLVGAEALVRWAHPERGLVPPAVFVPIAEMSDLVVALDRWMLAQVCQLLVRLDRQGHALRVSVNISPRHFQRSDFVESIRLQLADSGADPSRLMLEVTEGMVMGDLAEAVRKMTELSTLGLHFSMDDFGTGYSSLAYLKRLPISELKIDKSFVQDATSNPQDAALVDTILAVARQLHLQVVAEGVETPEQAAFLDARGDVVRQGYLYGRPEPTDTWLARVAPSPAAQA